MKQLIVSAPFGNYYKFVERVTKAEFTPTLGTFTVANRGFWTKPYGGRFTRLAATLRYSPMLKSWRNKIGLKNPGIEWLLAQVHDNKLKVDDKIVSIYGWTDQEWSILARAMATIKPRVVEVNASCPNVDKPPFTQDFLTTLHRYGLAVMVKLPPVGYRPIVEMAAATGVRMFHATNTLPTPKGGLSGKVLLPVALDVVKNVRQMCPHATIVGGGGITNVDDAAEFRKRGADHVAIGTMLFNPLNWRKVRKLYDHTGFNDDLLEALK